jgi:hypothetical protein
MMDAILSDPDLQDEILATQDAALERLRGKDFAGTLLRHVEEVRQLPLRRGAPVDPEFWRQFDAGEQMETLRLERPSAFRALPRGPQEVVS